MTCGAVSSRKKPRKGPYVLVLVKVERAGHSGQSSAQRSQHGAHAAMMHYHAATLHRHGMVHKAMN